MHVHISHDHLATVNTSHSTTIQGYIGRLLYICISSLDEKVDLLWCDAGTPHPACEYMHAEVWNFFENKRLILLAFLDTKINTNFTRLSVTISTQCQSSTVA